MFPWFPVPVLPLRALVLPIDHEVMATTFSEKAGALKQSSSFDPSNDKSFWRRLDLVCCDQENIKTAGFRIAD